MLIQWKVLLLAIALGSTNAFEVTPDTLPTREHRGAWIATVYNIDWPLSPTASVTTQQDQLKNLVSEISRAGLNAIYLQVRPTGDALYQSNIEPWSRYLTGEEGRAPSPVWDPLQYLINICHPLGIEIHAWMNPYRANVAPHTNNVAPNHMARVYPQYAYVYNTLLWMDPGAEAVQNRTTEVALDLVRRYDLDGLHLDDYFYPYPVAGWTFPDDNTYAAYIAGGGTMAKDDWRRDNVNRLVRRLNTEIHLIKPYVKFSVSPFGFDQFSQIFSDPKLWMQQGWVDMLQPQLYWKIDPPAQSYPTLLNWWVGANQNPLVRPVMAGNYLTRVELDGWPLDEIRRQVEISREPANRVRGSWGNVMYSAKMFRDNIQGTVDFFANYIYQQPALQPAFLWLAANVTTAPILPPKVKVTSERRLHLNLVKTTELSFVHQIAIYKSSSNGWVLVKVLPANRPATESDVGMELERGHYAVTSVDRFGRESVKSHFEI
ncbi:Glycosyl hydrolase YngK [Pseudolycoriella hygida]|uniref:Glycosyl hydrolase YngK n=1 Tax=Pseudolycoriella hygida TaxID=35572 RepID=A0A9Q0N6A5_9DIPT|nr:Glycosyl hydrolase YngK [Pseudolycoriella hygida]